MSGAVDKIKQLIGRIDARLVLDCNHHIVVVPDHTLEKTWRLTAMPTDWEQFSDPSQMGIIDSEDPHLRRPAEQRLRKLGLYRRAGLVSVFWVSFEFFTTASLQEGLVLITGNAHENTKQDPFVLTSALPVMRTTFCSTC